MSENEDRFQKVSEALQAQAKHASLQGNVLAGSMVFYGEALIAMLIDAVEKYAEAAARDREASERLRVSLARWNVVMIVATCGIFLSTAAYTLIALLKH